MAQVSDLPCDGDGVCMLCKHKASDGEIISCKTCVTPWHAACLTTPPKTLADAAQWDCPDCSDLTGAVAKPAGSGGGLVDKIRAIESDASLTDQEKAKRRQEVLSGGGAADDGRAKEEEKQKNGGGSGGVLGILGDKFNCSICMQLLDRPVSVRFATFSLFTSANVISVFEICISVLDLGISSDLTFEAAKMMNILTGVSGIIETVSFG